MSISAEPKSQRLRDASASEVSTYVLILAGGDGTRLRAVTRALSGDERPKQFCPLVGRETLLARTERRAALVAPRNRVLLSLTRKHHPWYRDLVAARDPFNAVIQPENRGTAAAVLYGLLRIATRMPHATVVVMPSDQWVSNDSAFMLHAQAAVGIVEAHPEVVVLLGVEPARPEPEFGWVERGGAVMASWGGLSRVARFVEKPSVDDASALYAGRASLWNTAVLVGRLDRILFLFAMARPELVDDFLSIWKALGSPSESAAAERLYAGLPPSDLSRDVLASQPEALSVLEVRGVAWEDLGRPAGVAEARRLEGGASTGRPERRDARSDCA